MRSAVAALSLCLAATSAAADPVVVELFTSQGCSSCPPADAMLGELSERSDVIALSLHVDYWDWIGWKDTFGSAAFSERQRAYAAHAGSSVVYTPQFVIDGTDQVAGASGMKLAELIDAHKSEAADVLRVGSTAQGRSVMAAETGIAASLILVTIEPKATVEILHGENAGKDVTYHNIVRGWDLLADWDGSAVTVPLPEAPDGMQQVVLAQTSIDGKPGPVTGAVLAD